MQSIGMSQVAHRVIRHKMVRYNIQVPTFSALGSRLRNAAKVLFLLALAMFATEREARAYADPGSGALIWQMLAGVFVGIGFYFRRLTSWFKNRKGPKD